MPVTLRFCQLLVLVQWGMFKAKRVKSLRCTTISHTLCSSPAHCSLSFIFPPSTPLWLFRPPGIFTPRWSWARFGLETLTISYYDDLQVPATERPWWCYLNVRSCHPRFGFCRRCCGCSSCSGCCRIHQCFPHCGLGVLIPVLPCWVSRSPPFRTP